MPDSPENKCPGPESQVAVHPVWGCDDEAIKDEFRRLQAERDKYLEWFQKADAELERLHFENEQRESGRSPVDSGTGCEKHGRTDCEDCYLDALAPGTGTDEKDIYSLVKAAEKTLEMLDAVGYEDKYHGKGELRAALAPFRASVSTNEGGDRRDDRRWEHVSEQSRVVYRRGIRAALLAALTDSEGREPASVEGGHAPPAATNTETNTNPEEGEN